MDKWNFVFKNTRVYSWYVIKNLYVKGFGYIGEKYYAEFELAKYIYSKMSKAESFESVISEISGAFIVIYDGGSRIYIGTDRIQAGGFVFYDLSKKIVSDDENLFWNRSQVDFQAIKTNLKSLLYTLDNTTYFANVFHLTAGEYVVIDKSSNKIERNFYYKHQPIKSQIDNSIDSYVSQIEKISSSVFRRLVSSLNGKTAIVPLSGGYDSRYIVAMLRKLGYEKVVCYTYGYHDKTEETGTSKRVADELGYPHYYVNEDDSFWEQFIDDSVVRQYLYSEYNISHTPHIQEIRAIEILKGMKGFPQDGVVIPGFCGDVFGGSYAFDVNQKRSHKYNIDELCWYIASNHLVSLRKTDIKQNTLLEGIKQFFVERKCVVNSLEEFNEAFNYWFFSHKIAKYIIPSVKAYEQMGYEWRIPLLDNELLDFWYQIPLEMKQSSSLYDNSLREFLFKKYNIDFVKKKIPRKQIEKQHRKARNVIGYSMLLNIYRRTGKLLMPRDSNNFIAVLKLFYENLQNKSCIGLFEERWLEPFVLWWLDELFTPSVVSEMFCK